MPPNATLVTTAQICYTHVSNFKERVLLKERVLSSQMEQYILAPWLEREY